MKKKWIFPAIAFGIFVILAALSQRCGMQQSKKSFNNFYSSHIEGILNGVNGHSRGVGFSIENSDKGFSFYPKTSELNNNKRFSGFAQKGDSIYKAAYSDTLRLFKENKVYLYTFSRIE